MMLHKKSVTSAEAEAASATTIRGRFRYARITAIAVPMTAESRLPVE